VKYFKVILISILILSLTNFVYSKTDLYLFGKGNFMNSSGSEADYKAGENDFPLASSYNTMGFGFGVTTGSGVVFFGLEAHYNLNGETTLTDTSDNDKVKIKTYEYVSGFITVGFNVIKNSTLRCFVNGGAGVSYSIDAEVKTYMSQFGYETLIEPPEGKYPITAFGGIGLVINISQSLGLFVNGRYQYMAQDQSQTSIITLLGLAYTF